MPFGEQQFENPLVPPLGKPEEIKEKEKTTDYFDFEKAKNVFNRNASSEERKEAVEIIKKITGPELIKKVFGEFDPFKQELRVEFREGEKKEAPAAYRYDDETGKEISYEINMKAGYSKRTEEKLFNAIAVGLHEIRHRAQYKNSELKKLTFEDVRGIGLFDRNFESKLKDIEKKPGIKNNLRQMDAVLFSETAALLYKNGASIQEIKNLAGMDSQELIKNLQKRKEKN